MLTSKYNIILSDSNEEEFVIINSIFGSVDIINKDEYKILSNESPSVRKSTVGVKKTINYFLERGYLIENKEEDEKRFDILYKAWKTALTETAPQFFVVLTYACNLNCVYCFQDKNFHNVQVMNSKRAKQLLLAIEKIVTELDVSKPPEIVLFGGEPLLPIKNLPLVVDEILRFCENNNYRTKVIS
ncbi:MAG: radical SAM protein [Promethearchaeota archaeon]